MHFSASTMKTVRFYQTLCTNRKLCKPSLVPLYFVGEQVEQSFGNLKVNICYEHVFSSVQQELLDKYDLLKHSSSSPHVSLDSQS